MLEACDARLLLTALEDLTQSGKLLAVLESPMDLDTPSPDAGRFATVEAAISEAVREGVDDWQTDLLNALVGALTLSGEMEKAVSAPRILSESASTLRPNVVGRLQRNLASDRSRGAFLIDDLAQSLITLESSKSVEGQVGPQSQLFIARRLCERMLEAFNLAVRDSDLDEKCCFAACSQLAAAIASCLGKCLCYTDTRNQLLVEICDMVDDLVLARLQELFESSMSPGLCAVGLLRLAVGRRRRRRMRAMKLAKYAIAALAAFDPSFDVRIAIPNALASIITKELVNDGTIGSVGNVCVMVTSKN